jgi:thiamine phosphate synthase YjbQ (UPF0047 family)
MFDPNWPWYLSKDGDLLELDSGIWYAHKPVLRRNCLPTFDIERRQIEAPSTLQRATAYTNKSRIVCTGAATIMHQEVPQHRTFKAFLQADQWLHWCIHNFHIEDEELLKEAILEGSAIAISDGSYKNFFGTASWTIGNLEVAALLSGQAVCPGAAPDMDSYRSELAGIYCIMAVVKKFCSFHHIKEGSIEIGCDGLSALDSAFERGDQLFHDIPSYDLVSAILQLRRCSPLTWSYRHVRGHQDEGSGYLDVWATRNIQMDVLAKQHFAFAQTAPRHFLIQGEPWQLWVGNRKLTSRIQAHIYSFVHDEDGCKYWKGKNDSSATAVDLVDWKSIGHAMRGVKRGW